jgi:DNA-binding response OmpR family regulator
MLPNVPGSALGYNAYKSADSVFNILLSAEDSDRLRELRTRLMRDGFAVSITPKRDDLSAITAANAPQLLVVELDGWNDTAPWDLLAERLEKVPPVLAIAPRPRLPYLVSDAAIDDFILKPYEVDELYVRVKRLASKLKESEQGSQILAGDLIIDTARCEVTISGSAVELTFREYELLKFLASNRGRVFSREVLLNKVWGYEYFGGDRTVDVHIRRLRAKIEDADHIYVETVRNIGYRFKRTP